MPENITKSTTTEICQVVSKILNISEEEVLENIHLFRNIDHYIFNSLYYLSKMDNKDKKINAVLSLEFVHVSNSPSLSSSSRPRVVARGKLQSGSVKIKLG